VNVSFQEASSLRRYLKAIPYMKAIQVKNFPVSKNKIRPMKDIYLK